MKERLSNDQTWCTPIPHDRKVSTVRDFYQAFHDASTLPIRTCMMCYRKRRPLTIFMPELLSEGEPVSVCVECARCLARGSLSPAVHLHTRLGCEHMFPDELKGLTLVEEKLVSLNSCYGHVKGHITVFPNNVQELATRCSRTPLQALDEIHVSWQGVEKPAPSDLSSLLSVRRRVVERALVWLKRSNPTTPRSRSTWRRWRVGRPDRRGAGLVYDRMERNEPSAWEKTRTAHVVPPTERAMDDEGSVEIEELFALLNQRQETGGEAEGHGPNEEGAGRDGVGASPDQNVRPINEVTSSGMFGLDGPPDVADVEKLRMLSVARKDFGKVERVARSMTAQRLAAARVELESSGKTTDEGVKELLRASRCTATGNPCREVRLNMRRKIQSLIVGYGVPAIWFTINPNDITNPVKLRLAAYRTRDPGAAEEFLEGLGSAYKQTRLAMSDPMSAAVFFHREMKLFFDHYVKVGEESVFGRIGKYYGAVETNERGRFMFTACSGCTETRISARCLPTSTGRIRRRIASESYDTSIVSSPRIWIRKGSAPCKRSDL
ncbi:Arrestin-lik [Hirsutella rhossiliensis]|uniref:Arrestin-lik n=1 Tax=Hirsutella rhossiliensis TaxID=111463 RepID=A0A9P8MNV1_9HYPO|nr:Arrestin-lik [Hirsutella rhossiliensis]KAH0958500.1 Arrestin-lik [Hirsutella rhossiliensis]